MSRQIYVGIDPTTTGVHYAAVSNVKPGLYDLIEYGTIAGDFKETVTNYTLFLKRVKPGLVITEDLSDWIGKKARFGDLKELSKMLGMVYTIHSLYGFDTLKLDVNKWRGQLGIYGKGQDEQVRAALRRLLSEWPERGSGFTNHQHDAAGVAVAGHLIRTAAAPNRLQF